MFATVCTCASRIKRTVAAVQVAQDKEAAGLGDAQGLLQSGLLRVRVHKRILIMWNAYALFNMHA